MSSLPPKPHLHYRTLLLSPFYHSHPIVKSKPIGCTSLIVFEIPEMSPIIHTNPITQHILIFSGVSFVLILIKPPVKSAGISGEGDFMIIIFSIWALGTISKEKALESASELGTALLLIHTLLYRWDNPRNNELIVDNRYSRIRFTTSEAS